MTKIAGKNTEGISLFAPIGQCMCTIHGPPKDVKRVCTVCKVPCLSFLTRQRPHPYRAGAPHHPSLRLLLSEAAVPPESESKNPADAYVLINANDRHCKALHRRFPLTSPGLTRRASKSESLFPDCMIQLYGTVVIQSYDTVV